VADGDRLAALTREEAEALDRADPLGPFRERFVLDDGKRIYVDGNSLGRLPRETPGRLAARVEEWGSRLVTAWPDWIDLPLEVGDVLAPVVGAQPGEVLVADSTTVNLYKLAHAALDVREGAIVARAGDFPTDRYVLQGLAVARGRELRLIEDVVSDVAEALTPPVALVCLSHVDYRTGALEDLPGVTAEAHRAGALALWDLSHSAGAVPVELTASGADLAVGCTYKYLNAGPGSPAYLYVRSELQPTLRSPIWGWFAQRDQFAMGPDYDPVDGIGRFLAGTPPVLGHAAVEEGAALIAEARIERLRDKSIALTSLVVALHEAWLAPLGFELGTPRDPDRRGAHVSLRHPDAWRICRALIERADVVPDFRRPDSIRYGLPPIYTRFVDAWDAVERLRRLVEDGVHLQVEPGTARVT
jgi:kynureninase